MKGNRGIDWGLVLWVACRPPQAAGDVVWRRCCGKPLFSSPRCCLGYVCIGCVDGRLLGFTHTGEQVRTPGDAGGRGACCSASAVGAIARVMFPASLKLPRVGAWRAAIQALLYCRHLPQVWKFYQVLASFIRTLLRA